MTVASWVLAARPKTLTASVVPVAVGTAFAFHAKGEASLFLTACALFTSALIQIGTNLVNDAIDFRKGTDTDKRLGPKRLCQSGALNSSMVLKVGIASLIAAVFVGFPLVAAGGFPLLGLLILSAILGYLYTGGPKALAYTGLGDLFVFLFFGVVATSAMYYIQTGSLDTDILVAGAQVGLTATLMIAINNLRDVAEDRKTMKQTIPVRFGRSVGLSEIAFVSFMPYVIGLLYWTGGVGFWPLLTLPLAFNIVSNLWITPPSPAYNIYLGQASILHLLFGTCLIVGLWF